MVSSTTANFRVDELYGYEETTVQPSSIGWTRPEKTHRLFGSRLAQQVIKHIKYDVEHGFDLPWRQDQSDPAPVIRMHEHHRLPVRMLPNHPQRMTMFVEVAKDVGSGVGAAWKERDGWKSRVTPLGKYLTEIDAASFGISMALRVSSCSSVEDRPQKSRSGDEIQTRRGRAAKHTTLGTENDSRRETTCGANQGRRRRSSHHMASEQY